MSLLQILGNAVRANQDASLRHAQIKRMNAMSDRELSDLGVSRDRIAHYVYRDIIGL